MLHPESSLPLFSSTMLFNNCSVGRCPIFRADSLSQNGLVCCWSVNIKVRTPGLATVCANRQSLRMFEGPQSDVWEAMAAA